VKGEREGVTCFVRPSERSLGVAGRKDVSGTWLPVNGYEDGRQFMVNTRSLHLTVRVSDFAEPASANLVAVSLARMDLLKAHFHPYS